MRGKESYIKIFTYLTEKIKSNEEFTIEEIVEFTGLKLSSMKVYMRNKLRGKYLDEYQSYKYKILPDFRGIEKKDFLKWMSQKSLPKKEERENIPNNFIENSKQAMLAAIEIHNKPQISYRYQIVTILVINSWELLLKGFIQKTQPETKIIKEDGTTKPFLECLHNIESNLGKAIYPTVKNLEILYEYRCNYTHYYNEKIDILLFGLIQKCIIFYNQFLLKYLNTEISHGEDLYILPLGFKKPISPLDFLTNKSFLEDSPEYLRSFMNEILEKIDDLSDHKIEDLIIVPFSMNLTNSSRVKNSDIIAAISNESDLKIKFEEKISISEKGKEKKLVEDDLYGKIYKLRYNDIVEFCRFNIKGWKQNKEFYAIMKKLKEDQSLHKIRLLDPNNPTGSKKDFYNPEILNALIKLYKKKV